MLRRSVSLVAAGAFVLAAVTGATAAILPMPATLELAIGTLPPATFSGFSPAASSAGVGGAATLPAGSISGTFSTVLSPPLLTLIDGFAYAGPGLVGSFAGALPAINQSLGWNGASGTMALSASAYLLMANDVVTEIPLGVIGVGGTQMFHVLTLVTGVIHANPYQLGMVTSMGALFGVPHTHTGTGVDNRTAGGAGQLVLVSPTIVDLGSFGSLASIATLTLGVPEPGTLGLLLAGMACLAAVGRRQRRR